MIRTELEQPSAQPELDGIRSLSCRRGEGRLLPIRRRERGGLSAPSAARLSFGQWRSSGVELPSQEIVYQRQMCRDVVDSGAPRIGSGAVSRPLLKGASLPCYGGEIVDLLSVAT